MTLNLIPLLPEIFLSLIGMGLLIVGVSQGNASTRVICWASAIGCAMTAVIVLSLGSDMVITLNGLFKYDGFAAFTKLLILTGVIATLALSVRFLIQAGIERFEYPILVLFAAIGMMIMVSANNLLTLYVGLELQSLALYVLAAFHRNSIKSSEAGVKYFILGALSSGLLLFGISLIYGFTGSIDFGAIEASLLVRGENIPFGVTFGLVFILAAIAFKISAVPFHMWTPDVYQGAPASVTAFFAIVPKVAVMALLLRLLFEPFMMMADQWMQIIYFISVASMLVGAFAALVQDNVKRLLAYSSIGNMGYALVGVVAASEGGVHAVLIYLMIYMIMTAGVFAVVLCMRRDGLAAERIEDLSGLSTHSPALAYCLGILMLSMAGIPPFAGFFGKFFVFEAAVEQGYYVLAVLGVLTSVVAAYYYLRIIKVMFFDDPADAFEGAIPFARYAVLYLSIAFVIGFAVKPGVFLRATQDAAAALFAG